ncbi:hypothetical protein [Ornithinibacillus sp. 179-J 7C1 HS]|uniref:hypothetical protein n=1 Tax=Ornithinibacillus sp. 179-J 7C1 HS TaxID=3142384 RepID=UPI00399FDF42
MVTKKRNTNYKKVQNLESNMQKSGKGIEQEKDLEFVIQKLINEKNELEKEFEEILRFILEDMKKQEQFISNALLSNEEPNDELVSYYKDKHYEANKKMNELEQQNKKLKNRIYALENSTLGKITLKYWELKNKIT